MASNQSQTNHKANWDSSNSFLCKQLLILQDQISSLITSNNPDPIHIINKAANIITSTSMSIPDHILEKNFKSNTSIPLSI